MLPWQENSRGCPAPTEDDFSNSTIGIKLNDFEKFIGGILNLNPNRVNKALILYILLLAIKYCCLIYPDLGW